MGLESPVRDGDSDVIISTDISSSCSCLIFKDKSNVV